MAELKTGRHPGRKQTCDCRYCDKCLHRVYMQKWRQNKKQQQEKEAMHDEAFIRHIYAIGAF